MIKVTKYVGIFCVMLLCWYIGNNVYLYYANTTAPLITLTGIEENSYYAGKLQGKISGIHPYKIATYSLFIDDKPVRIQQSIHRASFEHSITLPIDEMENGKHTIKISAISGTAHQNKTEVQRTFYVDNAPLHVGFIKHGKEHKVLQGRCLHVQFQVNKPIKLATISALSHQYLAYPVSVNSLMYEAFIPVDCEQHPSEYSFTVAVQDYVGQTYDLNSVFTVEGCVFKKKILHVPSGVLDREREFTELTDKDFELKMEELTRKSVREKLWQGSFEVPLAMTAIMTEFGVQRVAQERGSYIHKALDVVAAAPRAVVWASQAGIVVLKDRYIHSGNTIVIDHGYGILSMYFHLEAFANIEVGQKIRKGNPIGTMGKTGYANGYHLHWEMRVENTPIDPMQWTKKEFFN